MIAIYSPKGPEVVSLDQQVCLMLCLEKLCDELESVRDKSCFW